MQKRAKALPPLVFSAVPLAADFPLCYGGAYDLPGDDIGYLHLHDCLEIGWCESGEGEFRVDDKIMPFRGGDCFIVSEREFHLARSLGATRARWHFVQFDPAFLLSGGDEEGEFFSSRNFGGPGRPNVVPGAAHPELAGQFRLLVEELTRRGDGWRVAATALLRHLLVLFARATGRRPAPGGPSHDEVRRLAPAIAIINRDYATPLKVEDLAAACHLSAPHFCRLFRAAFHKAPGQYLTRFRMQMGAHLLRDRGAGVMEAALAVGYASPSTFHRHYKAMFGIAPQAAQKKGARPEGAAPRRGQGRKP